MANTTDKSILTAAGKALLAQLNAEEKPLIIDKMIFANVPNRPEFPQPDDVVPSDHVVHQEGVEQRGRLSADSVIYSTTLTSDVGPFEFNWTGAYCSEYGVLVTIDHHALTPKSADEPGVAGNTLVRSVVLEYKDIAEITNITVDASSWQYNATPRMKKMDDDVAQAIIDQNGKDWFIEDGFLVTPQASAFNIKAGAGYVSGNRVTLEFDRNVQAPNKPSFIYVDAHREGTPTGEQVTLFDFVVTADEKDDYTDENGVKHFVCKIAQVLADGSVSDLRPEGESASKNFVDSATGKLGDSLVGGHIWPVKSTEVVKEGDTIPNGTTHLRVLFNGDIVVATLYPASKDGGVVSELTADSCKIGNTYTVFDLPTSFNATPENYLTVLKFAKGREVLLSPGTYDFSNYSDSINLRGVDKEKVKLLLSTNELESLFDAKSIKISSVTLDDNGRDGIDKTGQDTAAAVLFNSTDLIKCTDVKFRTDRNICRLSNEFGTGFLYIYDCELERVNAPIPNERDNMNLISSTGCGIHHVEFLRVKDVICRSVINATALQAPEYSAAPAIFVAENNQFEYVRILDTSGEMKCIFNQGFSATIENNNFIDVFGRHIDDLSRYESPGVTNENIFKSSIKNNTITFTAARADDPSANFTEAGSIYCRYSDVTISDNYQDFSKLKVKNNVYSAITARHGQNLATIKNNTIISPVAHGILADISDAIDRDNSSVFIHDNKILNATNSSRVPIKITNNSELKKFGTVSIKNNEYEYLYVKKGIEVEQYPYIAGKTTIGKTLVVSKNIDVAKNAIDDLELKHQFDRVVAKDVTVSIIIDPDAGNAEGTMNVINRALELISSYEVAQMSITVADTVTEIMHISVRNIVCKPKKTVISGADSALLKWNFASNDQAGLSIDTEDNLIELSKFLTVGDLTSSTTSHFVGFGRGEIVISNGSLTSGEYAFDTRGADFYVKDTTVNQFDKGNSSNRSIIYCNSDKRRPDVTLVDVTGSDNTRLYNLQTPCDLVYQGLQVGVTDGIKTFTRV